MGARSVVSTPAQGAYAIAVLWTELLAATAADEGAA